MTASETASETAPSHGPLRIGVGGPVGAGKTTLTAALCRAFAPRFDMAAITNDIYTREDAEALLRAQVLPADRVMGVETGGCPHTAIREDCSLNLAAIAEMRGRHPALELVLIESGGDNLAATFSPDLADLAVYVIDVAQGDDIPRKGGPGVAKSDLLVVNKTDLAPYVGADLDRMRADSARVRAGKPTVFASLKSGEGVDEICAVLQKLGGL